MKLTLGLAAALAGFATAADAQQPAHVYLLPSSKPSSAKAPAPVSASLARLIFLQRLSPFGKGPSVADSPKDATMEDVVAAMNSFGKAPPAVHLDNLETTPHQLVVILEDMTTSQMAELEKQVKKTHKGLEPAFEIPNPPSTRAHDDLVEVDFHGVGVTTQTTCDIDLVIDPKNEKCWGKETSVTRTKVARYNVQKDGKVLEKTKAALKSISSGKGALEIMLVALPAVEDTAPSSWQPEELRRRQAEEVMTAIEEEDPPAETTAAEHHDFYISTAARKPIPACFSSADNCVTGTGNCSGHGSCQNRYAKKDGSEGKEVCYSCHCLSTVTEKGGLTQWAGGACSKKDVSTPFWLFAGFTIVMLGILTLAIGMLFSVGEEKLPGVIGAGVSRSK